MNITKFAINRDRVILSLLLVVITLGLVFYQSLSRDSMPPYTVRVATVVSSFPGASPLRVEELVTDKVEKVVQELPELKEVVSTSRTGLSVVEVELGMSVKPENLQSVWDRLRRKLNDIPDLPEGVYPQLKDDGIGEVFGIAVGLSSDGYSYQEMKSYADDIRNDLIKLPDAAKVEINGAQAERVFIRFDEARLKSYGLTSNRLFNIISSTNILNSGGVVNVEEERITLEPSGNFNDLDGIRQLLIPVGSEGQVVSLSDIAQIEKGYVTPATQLTRVNGKEALSLHISLKEGANILSLGEGVDELLNTWNERLPLGLDLFRVSSLDSYIDLKIDDFVMNLLQAIAIVMGIMLFFLGIRTGLIISSLIPLVMITTFMVMGLLGVGINQITLAALIMSLGIMVDNGIVVAESIVVKMKNGLEVKQAAIDTASELFFPLLISTGSTSAAFISFYLAESIMGDIIGPIFVVIAIALFSSWMISFTIIALFCVYFLKQDKESADKPKPIDRLINWLKHRYSQVITWALVRKGWVLTGIFGLLMLAFYGFGYLNFVFFPDSDRNMITVDINLPEGTRIEATEEIVEAIEGYLSESSVSKESERGVLDWTSYIGEGPSSYDLGYIQEEPNSNYAHILVNTSSFEYNAELISNLDAFCFDSFPNADIKVKRLGSTGGGAPVEIKVSGSDLDELMAISERIKTQLVTISGTKNVQDDWGPKGKKFLVDIDEVRAQNAGVTNQDIAISLQTYFDGFIAGEFREDDKSIPIVLRGAEDGQQSLSSLTTLNVYAQNSGNSVPLSQVATLVPEWQNNKIKRLDLNRTITVTSELTEDGNAAQIVTELSPWLENEKDNWKNGYDYSFGGDEEQAAENMGAVMSYLPLSGFIIVLLLMIQFNSFRKMTMIVLTIPLGVIGMVIGLLVFQVPFGFMAFLGVISLAGIVMVNAIVLIDRIGIEQNQLQRSPQDSVISAALQRFRPILLATFTTVLGLIPLYLGGGDIWRPMAVTIMVGLLFGTIITLMFIPSMYSLLYKINYKGYELDPKLID
ncbi:efflux RND transporter permease subunit [Lutimonas zeaxanthinifaciens]|uniref:efflux RND transporter permease subunit n=1 Tax=Lutimonas zeaxanthinifaciens TaxID=3060215 RepID=UPI00265D5E8F|nr:efflux RND transporter permease subunit [Lutimonas sp. YSD2104]WKK65907.1 efflux RND transporter permease subunit [Lutimonas sp. YSD2104]